jgi:DNA mismatch repair protein MutL
VIRVLEDRVINKIAAGEVVERPASVVKELFENAIDAGAGRIRVDLESGGRRLIRITDDGTGMTRQDATLCIERHATSKIRSDEDLFKVSSLGFRGEALPSIAAIGRFELLTRTHDSEVGTRVAIEGGRLIDISEAGCPAGTDIRLRSIFFNLPGRRKFLRTVPTELSHSLEAVTRQALIRPNLDLELIHDGKSMVRAPVVSDGARRAADLLGPHGRALVAAQFSEGPLEVEALISPVGVHRASSRGCSYLYVNGRYVQDLVLRRAVREAYRGLVPKGRYPTVVIHVRVPPDHVDVNVHPAKTEVRFRFGNDLSTAVAVGLRRALEGHGIKRPVATEARYQPDLAGPEVEQSSLPLSSPAPRPWQPTAAHPASSSAPPHSARPSAPFHEPLSAGSSPLPPGSPGSSPLPRGLHLGTIASEARRADSRDLLPVACYGDLRALGQFVNTYILCEGAGELVVIDQHAAHERVMLHQLMQAPLSHLGAAQLRLTPQIIELTPARAQALAAHTESLTEFGFEVEPFGGDSFAVKQVPDALGKVDLQRLLEDVSDDIADGGTGAPARDVVELALATMACHSAIRSGDPLSPYEMRELLHALDRVDFSVCAHGRPVTIRISQAELERRFHRT